MKTFIKVIFVIALLSILGHILDDGKVDPFSDAEVKKHAMASIAAKMKANEEERYLIDMDEQEQDADLKREKDADFYK
jgi:hypothetical protein